MKIKSLKIKNIGMISDEVIPFDKPLILFYGDIKQGKTTILNSVRLVMGGSFPADIIKHGANEALIDMEIENGSISRSFYVNKDGVTVSRPQSIVINNKIAGVKDLKAFLNPFLLNQNHLSDMNDTERIKFIIDLFNVDTTDLDSEISTEEINASAYRLKIKSYGVMMLEVIERPDLEKLSLEKSQIETKLSNLETLIKSENEALKKEWESQKNAVIKSIYDFNADQDIKQQKIDSFRGILNEIFAKIKGTIFEKCFDVEGAKRTLLTLPQPLAKKEIIFETPEPIYNNVDKIELEAIEAKIQEAKIQQVKYESYLKDKDRFDAKLSDEAKLKELENKIKTLREKRASKVSEINGKIPGLTASDGSIMYENTSFNMLSTSQIMKLSSELSALYPDGFGLELIDRGESLGKSIFEFVKKAEKEQRTILATIVGDRPANVPENIGVYVVANGSLN